MKRSISTLFVVAVMVLATACSSAKKEPLNTQNILIPQDTQKRYTADKIGNIIARTAAERGWTVQKAGSVIECGLVKGGDTLFVKVTYSQSTYSISGPVENRLYDRYVRLLKAHIDKALAVAAYE